MDYLELLFAAEVRKLARNMLLAEQNAFVRQVQDEPDRDMKLAAWSGAHSVDGYIPAALDRIKNAAFIIRQHQ